MFTNTKIDIIENMNASPPSHHTIGESLLKAITFDLTLQEMILIITFLVLVAYFVLLTLSTFLVGLKNYMFGKDMLY